MQYFIIILSSEFIILLASIFTGFTIYSLYIKYSTGWHQIEKLFRSEKNSVHHFLGWQTFELTRNTLRIGTVENNLSGFIKLGVTNSGIYLGFHVPYYPLLNPVNIPWREIEIQKEAGSDDYEIIIKKNLKPRIVLSLEIAEMLGAYRKEFEAVQKQSLNSPQP